MIRYSFLQNEPELATDVTEAVLVVVPSYVEMEIERSSTSLDDNELVNCTEDG